MGATPNAKKKGWLGIDSYLGWPVDFASPAGEPALLEPDSVQWRISKNMLAMVVGGYAAVLMELAEPRIRSGVWNHSTYSSDPFGRSQRTAIAAMIGVYAPASAARRVIANVTRMHARVTGTTERGEPYRALDPELLDWVGATAGYGFLAAYERFVTPLGEADRTRYYRDGATIARLYGMRAAPMSNADFLAMMDALAPRFEPHRIVDELLVLLQSSRAAPGVPRMVRRALLRGAISLLPPLLRDRLALGREWDLTLLDIAALKLAAQVGERWIDPRGPAAQASLRLGLPADFLVRDARTQARLLAARRAA